jgi:hypothetical protein
VRTQGGTAAWGFPSRPARATVSHVMRRATAVVCAMLLLLSACKPKGSKKGARLASERLQPLVAKFDGVDPTSVTVAMDEEVFRNLWAARASAPGKDEWRCFVDVADIFCDHGEGKIFPQLVAYRRLGDNRASVDDPAWIQLVRHAYALKQIYPEKDFPYLPGINPNMVRVPRVERPNDGGVFITLFAIGPNDKTVKFEIDVTGEGTAKVTQTQLP